MTDAINKSRKKPTKIEEMTKEQIRQCILKKRECNDKAQQIVESLLEKYVPEDYFLRCLSDINQCHLEDIIEERAIIHLCGYPLCQKTISEKDIPKQKYRISIKTNKVYDITTRKKFCSNSCYNSAMHIKKQMLTSPLWYREYEVIPTFHLLEIDSVGSLGQEIDVAFIEKINIKSDRPTFTSINDFASASLNDMPGNDLSKDDNKKPAIDQNISSEACILSEKDKQNKENENRLRESETLKSKISDKNAYKNTKTNPLNIVGEIIEKPERKIDPILTSQYNNMMSNKTETQNPESKKLSEKKQPLIIIITIEVEKCLAEWFTLDTLLFLFGADKVREMVTDKGECIKEYLNNYTKGIFYNSNSYDQYQELCRKLNLLELEDRRYDSQTLQRETKPLPSYSILQEESKQLQLKVKAFFEGETEILETNTAEEKGVTTDEDSNLTLLPLVDKNSQNALRRKIVCEHLNKVLPDILSSLGLLSLSISSDIRLLVNTFKLKANNIMFKPVQWTLIAIVFIKLLSLRDQKLGHLLEQQTAYSHMQLLLLSYKQDGGYLDRLISWLTDIDRLLDTKDTQLTIE